MTGSTAVALVACLGFATVAAPPAHADTVAYLVNVTVRPGYDFAGADAALAYGYGICDQVAAQRSYADIVAEILVDFDTGDEYHGTYLVGQAVNELCPQHIWQLRRSAESLTITNP